MHTHVSKPPRLLFGDTRAHVEHSFQALADQFSHVAPRGDFDSSASEGFLYKGCVFAMEDLVVNHAINSHLVATTDFTHFGLSLILSGHSSVSLPPRNQSIPRYMALLSPPGTVLRFETSAETLTSSLHLSFDLARLGRVSIAMQGGEGAVTTETQLRTVRLHYGPINLRRMFLGLLGQIDAFGGDAALLRAAGFDDQIYRLLAIVLQPEVFLASHLTGSERRALQVPRALEAFERFVEAHLDEPLRLTDIEVLLGVSARALQYSCVKRHGCSPRTYIRNRRLDLARALLSRKGGTLTLAEVAAQLHFSSQSQFARYFRERFGCRPSDVAAGHC